MKIRLTLALLLFCILQGVSNSANSTQQALTTDQAKNVLALSDVQRNKGQFTQLKYFNVLPKPFKSTGYFELNKDTFIWQTLVPVKSAFLVEDNVAFTVDGQGAREEQPQAQYFVELLQSMIKADLDGLAAAFNFHQSSAANCIMLLPVNDDIAQLFSSIELCGEQQVKQVTLFELADNRTQIKLSYSVGK